MVGDIDLVPKAPLREERLGEKEELERRHRALDGHLRDVEHDASAGEPIERATQSERALERVEVEGGLLPSCVRETRRLLGQDAAPRRHDENVVGEHSAVGHEDLVLVRCDAVDLAEPELDARVEKVLAPLHDLLRPVLSEWEEQQARLVEVDVVTVDDGDAPRVFGERPYELVGHHRPAGAASQDHDALHDGGPRGFRCVR